MEPYKFGIIIMSPVGNCCRFEGHIPAVELFAVESTRCCVSKVLMYLGILSGLGDRREMRCDLQNVRIYDCRLESS